MNTLIRHIRSRSMVAYSCFFALAWLGCGRSEDPADSRISTITIQHGDPGDEFFLNPNRWSLVQFPIFLTLTTKGLDGKGPQPLLAERWEHSPDYREWTIHLRPNVKWHDGVPVTAHDVKYTMDLWANPDVLYPAGGRGSATVLNDSTLRITYERPSREPLGGWNVYYPKHLLENLDPKDFAHWEFWKHPVGNGAYRVVRHVPRTLMELEANPHYCCGKPRIERVVLKFSDGTPLTELLSGNVDAAQVSPAELPALAGDPRFETYYLSGGEVTVHLFWNHRNELFRDADIRRALTMAIDRRELHRVLNLPGDLPITDGIYTARQYRRGRIGAALPYDPEAAEDLLDSAGWRAGSRGGLRERNGREFRFTAIVPHAAWLASPIRAATFIQDQLRRIGVRMEIQQLVSADVVGRQIADGAFESAITYLVNSPWRLAPYFGQGSPIGYDPPRVTELLRAAEVAMDLDEQDRIYSELAEIFNADVPVTFLYPKVENWVVHRRVRGLSSPYRAEPVWHVDQLWIEEEGSEP